MKQCIQFSPISCRFLPLGSKCDPQCSGHKRIESRISPSFRTWHHSVW
jgi:hypothetical protein